MHHWEAIDSPTHPHAFAVALLVPLVNGDARVERVHPIEFTDRGEADRAAARLNARDAGITGIPAPVAPEEQIRAERQARIAELRRKRQVVVLDPDQPAPDLDPEQHFGNEHELPPHAHLDEH